MDEMNQEEDCSFFKFRCSANFHNEAREDKQLGSRLVAKTLGP